MDRQPVSPLIGRALEVAERRLGAAELCLKLGVDESTLQLWRLGRAPMPQTDFLRLIDILTGLDVAWSEWNP